VGANIMKTKSNTKGEFENIRIEKDDLLFEQPAPSEMI
jgi:hypothetical protein